MYCEKCGNQCYPGNAFCSNCGARIGCDENEPVTQNLVEYVDSTELMNCVRAFVDKHKSNRIFMAGDESFDRKYQSFRKSILLQVGRAVGQEDMELEDGIRWFAGDKIRSVLIQKRDAVALFDNTKVGLFGNIAKKDCEYGVLITTKGIVTLSGVSDMTGYLSWKGFLAGNQSGENGYPSDFSAVTIFDSDQDPGVYPRGDSRALNLSYFKISHESVRKFVNDLRAIVGRCSG